LNDIDGFHVTATDVEDALDAAAGGPLELGSVGGGTGMIAYQLKRSLKWDPANREFPGDDEANRDLLERRLLSQGYQPVTVDGGEAAIEYLGTTDVDMILLDMIMPGLDGIALALRAGRDYPDLPILLMMGYSAERQRAHNLDRLAIRFILKPFTLQQICDAVEETLSQAAAAPRVAAQAYTAAR